MLQRQQTCEKKQTKKTKTCLLMCVGSTLVYLGNAQSNLLLRQF